MKPLSILYVGPADEGTCKSRLEALQRLGHRVEVVNLNSHLKRNAVVSKIQMKICNGPAVLRFNKEILKAAKLKKLGWVWVDKGVFVLPTTVRNLKSLGLFLIHHCTDDFLNPNQRMRHYMHALHDYHVHLTSNLFNLKELKDLGVRFPVLTHLGFDPRFCPPLCEHPLLLPEYSSEIAFIGHWRKHIDDYLIPLIQERIQVKLWGQDWNRSEYRKWYKDAATFRRASDEEYPSIIGGAKIALCFLSRENRNTSTGRTFEIPAIGTFMLGERTEEHLTFFEEGREAEFFGTPQEFLEKVKFYLHNDEARMKIAAAGHRRALTSGYTYLDRIRKDLENIMPIYRRVIPPTRRTENE